MQRSEEKGSSNTRKDGGGGVDRPAPDENGSQILSNVRVCKRKKERSTERSSVTRRLLIRLLSQYRVAKALCCRRLGTPASSNPPRRTVPEQREAFSKGSPQRGGFWRCQDGSGLLSRRVAKLMESISVGDRKIGAHNPLALDSWHRAW